MIALFLAEAEALRHSSAAEHKPFGGTDGSRETSAIRKGEQGEAAQHLMFEARRSLGLEDGTDYIAHSRRIFGVVRKR